MLFIFIILGLVAVIALYVIVTYNSLVSFRQLVSQAWSDIDVQLRRRYDLVPNLVETVKGYAGHEKATLEAVITARNAAVANQGTPSEQAQSENMLSGALKSLFALSEAYPDLKANQNFAELQAELSDLENVIQNARRFYNGSVNQMNTKVQQFPSNLVANQFGFSEAEFFELDNAAAREAVAVQF